MLSCCFGVRANQRDHCTEARVAPGMEQVPVGLSHRDVAAVAVDRNDRVYLATRVRSCIFVYERDGTFVRTWGEAMFSDRLHGLMIYPDGTLYIVDDAGHSVRPFPTDGKELAPLGPVGEPSDTGLTGRASRRSRAPRVRTTARRISRSRRTATCT